MEQIVAAGRTVCALDAEATKTRFAPTQARGLSPDLARSRPISPDLVRPRRLASDVARWVDANTSRTEEAEPLRADIVRGLWTCCKQIDPKHPGCVHAEHSRSEERCGSR